MKKKNNIMHEVFDYQEPSPTLQQMREHFNAAASPLPGREPPCGCVCHNVGLFGLLCCPCTRKALDELVNGKPSMPVMPEALAAQPVAAKLPPAQDYRYIEVAQLAKEYADLPADDTSVLARAVLSLLAAQPSSPQVAADLTEVEEIMQAIYAACEWGSVGKYISPSKVEAILRSFITPVSQPPDILEVMDDINAIQQVQNYLLDQDGKSPKGYFAPGGWAYERLTHILNKLKAAPATPVSGNGPEIAPKEGKQ